MVFDHVRQTHSMRVNGIPDGDIRRGVRQMFSDSERREPTRACRQGNRIGTHLHDGYALHMTITLPDDPALLSLDEAQVRLEVACGLFASARVSRAMGARIAGLDRATFDEALFVRHIPSYTSEMLDQDLAAWKTMPKG